MCNSSRDKGPPKSSLGFCHSPHTLLLPNKPSPPGLWLVPTPVQGLKKQKEENTIVKLKEIFCPESPDEQVSQLPEPLSSPSSLGPQDPWVVREEVTLMDTDHQSPCSHSQEVDQTHAVGDTLQVAGLGGPEGPWPDSGRRPSQGPVILGSQRDEVTLVNVVTRSPVLQRWRVLLSNGGRSPRAGSMLSHRAAGVRRAWGSSRQGSPPHPHTFWQGGPLADGDWRQLEQAQPRKSRKL